MVEGEVRDGLGLGLAPWEEEEEGVRVRLREGVTLREGLFQLEMLAAVAFSCVEVVDFESDGFGEEVRAGE